MIGRLLKQISDQIDRGCRAGAIFFFAAMVALVMLQVVARYIFRAVPIWTEEAARYCMVWGGLLGATVAFKANRDPKLIAPPTAGPRLWLRAASALRMLAVLCFLGPILYHSNKFLARHWDRTAEALGISTFWVTLAVPIAVLTIFIHLSAKAAGSSGRRPESESTEAE
jgi:TRAP-type C4-dicarboxylate transport system permease small subunit